MLNLNTLILNVMNLIFAAFVVFVVTVAAFAQNLSLTYNFSTYPSIVKSFVVNKTGYYFSVSTYIENSNLSPYITSYELTPTKLDTPEKALILFLQGASKLNVNDALLAWTAEAKNKNFEIWHKFNISTEQIVAEWSNWNFSSVRLLNRITYEGYTLIEYSVLEKNGVKTLHTIALEKTYSGNWGLTHALADNPILCCWKTAGLRTNQNGQLIR
jgi:hypothetical protein